MNYARSSTVVPIPSSMSIVGRWYSSDGRSQLRLNPDVERWCVYNLQGHWGVQVAADAADDSHPEFNCLHKLWFEHFTDAALFKFRWFG